jgi:hypothetical protein
MQTVRHLKKIADQALLSPGTAQAVMAAGIDDDWVGNVFEDPLDTPPASPAGGGGGAGAAPPPPQAGAGAAANRLAEFVRGMGLPPPEHAPESPPRRGPGPGGNALKF